MNPITIPGGCEGKNTINSKVTEPRFVGSFFALDQLPSDRLPQVAIAGRSNVGKSSLLNRIVGRRKLARVSSTPGRTRSLNFFCIDNRYYLVDLPGYGFAKVSKSLREQWGKLIEEYLSKGDHLIGLILLMDCRRKPTPEDSELLEWLATRGLPVMVAVTKSDKLAKSKLGERIESIENDLGAPAIAFSSVTGLGKKELMSAIRTLVDEHKAH